MLHRSALVKAFGKVKSAKGAPGVDGQTLQAFEANLQEELDRLVFELRTKTYRPSPVLRVTIPKPGGGERHLGIPCVRDRVVQQVLLEILQPIFDPEFHPSSYRYRPGRSCQQAVAKATLFVREYDFRSVVDMDLSKCFDRLNHDLILASIGKRVQDGSILKLIGMFLESGVMVEGNWQASEIGSPQGGVISPLIAYIYLVAFDQQMKSRGHRLVRYADDILILSRSHKAANHALEVARSILEEDLLVVNQEKTHVVNASLGISFLGVVIYPSRITIQAKKVEGFPEKVKQITLRNSPVNLEKVIADLNPVLRGFANYFKMAKCKGWFREKMQWIRRRLRVKQLALWKKPGRLHRRLRQQGYTGDFVKMRMRNFRSSRSHLASWAMPNKWFAELGLFDLESVAIGVLPQVC